MDSRYLSNWRSYASWHLYSYYSPCQRKLLVSQMCRDLCSSTPHLFAGLSIDMLSFSHSRRNNFKWIVGGSKVTENSLFGHKTIFREMICRKLIVLILVWFERSLLSAQVSGQSYPWQSWQSKLMTSQAVERTWIRTGGHGGSGANGLSYKQKQGR